MSKQSYIELNLVGIVAYGDIPLIQEFLSHNPKLNQSELELAFQQAVRIGSIPAVRLIMQYIDSRNVYQHISTLRWFEIYTGISFLPQYIRPQIFGKALNDASSAGQIAILQYLISHQSMKVIDNIYIEQALGTAVIAGHQSIAQIILSRCCDKISLRAFTDICISEVMKGGTLILKHLLNTSGLSSYTLTRLLNIAAKHGNLSSMSILLDSNPGKFSPVTIGEALCNSSIGGHIKVVEYLLSHFSNKISLHALQRAINYTTACEHPSITILLLEYGKKKHKEYDLLSYTLPIAAKNNTTKVVMYILKHIDNASIKQHVLDESLGHAASMGSNEITYELLPRCSVSGIGKALINSAKEGKLGIVSYILNHKLSHEIESSNIATTLIAASGQGHQAVVRCLLSYEHSKNITSTEWEQAIIESGSRGNLAMMRYLLSLPRSTNITEHVWNTILPIAAQGNYVDIVKYILINAGKQLTSHVINAAFNQASAYEQLDSLQALIDYDSHTQSITRESFISGLDTAVTSNYNKTAVHILFSFNRRFPNNPVKQAILDPLLQRLLRSLSKNLDAVKVLLGHIHDNDKPMLYRRLSPSIVVEMITNGVGELPSDLIALHCLKPVGEQYKDMKPYTALTKALDELVIIYNKDQSLVDSGVRALFPTAIISAGSEITKHVLLKSTIKNTLVSECNLPNDLVDNAVLYQALGMSFFSSKRSI
jgi:hypothetical protein